MIELERVSFGYKSRYKQPSAILDEVSAVLPTSGRLAILGQTGSGKTTLIRILANLQAPDSGRVNRFARLSFPAGLTTPYRPTISLRANLAYLARVYGADPEEIVNFVGQVAEVEDELDQPFGDLEFPIKSRVGHIACYALDFDTYLIDNNVGPGDPVFKRKCEIILEERAKERGFILTTRNARIARRWADKFAVLDRGGLTLFQNADDAMFAFDEAQKSPKLEQEQFDMAGE